MNANNERAQSLISQSSLTDVEEARRKTLSIFREESQKSDEWQKKYIYNTMFLLGSGAYGSVFQVSTRLYTQGKPKISKDRFTYSMNFLSNYLTYRRIKSDNVDNSKLIDKYRDSKFLDVVAIKYEILEQSHLEDVKAHCFLFLRREFLVLDAIWKHPSSRHFVGIPIVFDFGYLGDKLQYGINSKYSNTFSYHNIRGEQVEFFKDPPNKHPDTVTKISYMAMELLGPSIDDFRNFFEPWYTPLGMKTFFQAPTVFKIADQTLCRLLLLHKCGFVHHDLKPDNIAVGNGRAANTIYLLDYGFAKQVSNADLGEWMGSRKFISAHFYDTKHVNYGQDIESWFYLVCALLCDRLPWSDEMLSEDVAASKDEKTKWDRVVSLKRSWWMDSKDSSSLKQYFDTLEQLHCDALPDIRRLMEMLHRRVRDLRQMMINTADAKTLLNYVNNESSNVLKSYIGIRKILLLIFSIDASKATIKDSQLYDSEFISMQTNRKESKGKFFPFTPKSFYWEWDENMALMINKLGAEARAAMPMSSSNRGVGGDIIQVSGNNSISAINRLMSNAGSSCTSMHHLLSGSTSRKLAADEVSYVYDASTDRIVPKTFGWRDYKQL